MRENLSGDQILTLHQGHTPEITFQSDSEATGIWYLEDTVLSLATGSRIYGAAIYQDEYLKLDGRWYISKTGYERTFECVEPLPGGHMVLKNRFSRK